MFKSIFLFFALHMLIIKQWYIIKLYQNIPKRAFLMKYSKWSYEQGDFYSIVNWMCVLVTEVSLLPIAFVFGSFPVILMLLLAVYSRITPCGTWKTTWDVRDGTQVGFVQVRCPIYSVLLLWLLTFACYENLN